MPTTDTPTPTDTPLSPERIQDFLTWVDYAAREDMETATLALSDLRALLTEVQRLRAGTEQAAKKVCQWCQSGELPGRGGISGWIHYGQVYDEECAAAPIWDVLRPKGEG